jgi:RNA ligase
VSFVNLSEIKQLLSDGRIIKSEHPSYPLWILNYSASTQYDKFWTPLTLMCRGLVINYNTGEIVARPLSKFFNWEELTTIPNEPFEVYEKLDGSLIIIFQYEGEWIAASRGSFLSEQALIGGNLLRTKYVRSLETKFDGLGLTFMAEVLAKKNRIVVDYGDTEDLFGLAVIRTETGEELPIETFSEIGMETAKRHNSLTSFGFDKLKQIIPDTKEGFVIRFKSGLRMKIKGEEYVRLHRIVTNVSSTSIWEYLATEKSMDELLDRVPDEFYNWVKSTVAKLKSEYGMIESECLSKFESVKNIQSRKEFAESINDFTYKDVLFRMLDGKEYKQSIWRKIKPEYKKPFKETNE